jgi:hypothetical protein
MSILSSLDIKFVLDGVFSSSKLIDILVRSGWEMNDYGKLSYLPLNDADDFVWKVEDINESSIINLSNIFIEKERLGETLGVVMTWRRSMVGGNFLLFGNGEVSIIFNINRKVVLGTNITDVNWYLERIFPSFSAAGLVVESFKYSEHI